MPLAEKLLEVPQQLMRTALDLELQEGTVIADRVGETPSPLRLGKRWRDQHGRRHLGDAFRRHAGLFAMTMTVRLAGENHQPFSGLWRFEQGQEAGQSNARSTSPENNLHPTVCKKPWS